MVQFAAGMWEFVSTLFFSSFPVSSLLIFLHFRRWETPLALPLSAATVVSGSLMPSFSSQASTSVPAMRMMLRNSTPPLPSTCSEYVLPHKPYIYLRIDIENSGLSSPSSCSCARSGTRLLSSSSFSCSTPPFGCLPSPSTSTALPAKRLAVCSVSVTIISLSIIYLIHATGILAALAAWYAALSQLLTKDNSFFQVPLISLQKKAI
jgi:GPR1/FUN34/yaaH family